MQVWMPPIRRPPANRPAVPAARLQAFYRAAKGAMGLRKYDRCIELCEQGLAIEADNRELKDMKRRAAVEKDAQVGREGPLLLSLCLLGGATWG